MVDQELVELTSFFRSQLTAKQSRKYYVMVLPKKRMTVATPDKFIAQACELMQIERSMVVSKARAHPYVQARHLICLFLYTGFLMRHRAIGKLFGRDHTFAGYAIYKAIERISTGQQPWVDHYHDLTLLVTDKKNQYDS